jgi:hypothetical protein
MPKMHFFCSQLLKLGENGCIFDFCGNANACVTLGTAIWR